MSKAEKRTDYRPLDTTTMMHMCLNCTRISCNHGTCPEIEKEDQKREKYKKENTKMYYMDGETHPLSFWASLYDITPGALLHRLKQNGGNLKKALLKKGYYRPSKTYTAFGHTLTVTQWAALCDVSVTTIRNRLRSGQPIEVVLYEAKQRLKEGRENV